MVNDAGGVDGHPIELAVGGRAGLRRRARRGRAAPPRRARVRPRQLRQHDLGAARRRTAARHGMLYLGDRRGRGDDRRRAREAWCSGCRPRAQVLGRTAIAFVADQLAPASSADPRDLRYAVSNVDDVYGSAVARGAVQRDPRAGTAVRRAVLLRRCTTTRPRRVVRRIAAATPGRPVRLGLPGRRRGHPPPARSPARAARREHRLVVQLLHAGVRLRARRRRRRAVRLGQAERRLPEPERARAGGPLAAGARERRVTAIVRRGDGRRGPRRVLGRVGAVPRRDAATRRARSGAASRGGRARDRLPRAACRTAAAWRSPAPAAPIRATTCVRRA